jgi:hypothetical protein
VSASVREPELYIGDNTYLSGHISFDCVYRREELRRRVGSSSKYLECDYIFKLNMDSEIMDLLLTIINSNSMEISKAF